MACHDTEPSFGTIGCVRKRVDGRHLERQLDAAHAGEVDGQPEKVGTTGQERESPGEGEGKVELVGRFLLLGEEHNGVFEGQEDTWINIEGQVQVQRTAASLLGVEVDFPNLTQGVRLDKVPLVVDMKPVVNGVIL